MQPHVLAIVLRKLKSAGLRSAGFTRLHHFSMKGRPASLSAAIAYFETKTSIAGQNLSLADRCAYVLSELESGRCELDVLIQEALERFPLHSEHIETNSKHLPDSQRFLEEHGAEKNMAIPSKLRIAAARVCQGDLVLFTMAVKVRDLVTPGFYSVETLDPEDPNDAGYQRLLNKARAKKLADYVVKGQDSRDAFLPTSVFLATHKVLPFDPCTNTIEIDLSDVGPFSVVDGQHRLEGLKMAAEKDERVLDFDVPVNIAIGLPKIAQMCHFLIVNTTQKSVDKSVEQRIIARLTEALDVEDDLPSLPKWIFNTVEKGEVDRALKYVDYLNETEGSPWFGKIKMANSSSDEAAVNQRSFVKAIVKYVLTANNPLATIIKDLDKERRIFLNYWIAIAAILDDGNAAVLYKYNGVELFCKFSIPFFIKLQDRGSFTVSTMESLLRSCFENVEGDYAGVGHPEWWAKGGKSSFLNAGAINVVSQEMAKALHKSAQGGAIEI
jgi:DGQHR domain-containing protein